MQNFLKNHISANTQHRDKKFICSESVDQARQYEAGCGGIWQGVGACGRVRGSGRVSGLQHRQRHVAGVG